MLLKVGVGPYDHNHSHGVRLGDVYTGGMDMIKDHVWYRYIPSGSVFKSVGCAFESRRERSVFKLSLDALFQ
ncbi:MAG: hypothetical protein H0S79_16185 [Anaerolineaceae bacterium]|nr:hypothetical protein [Anaerolineaceae bacterium]